MYIKKYRMEIITENLQKKIKLIYPYELFKKASKFRFKLFIAFRSNTFVA